MVFDRSSYLLRDLPGKSIYAHYFHPGYRHMNEIKYEPVTISTNLILIINPFRFRELECPFVKAPLKQLVICQDKDPPMV